MQISLRELELFTATIELGTLTAAAETLGMSQPAASKLLRNLEARLSLTLFRRSSRNLLPTPDALAIYPGLTHALGSLDAVKRTAFNLRDGQNGQIHVVTNPAVAANILPSAIQEFRRSFERIDLIVRTHTTLEVMEMISKGRADIGVIYEAGNHDSLSIENIGEAPIGCLMQASSPLAKLEEVTLHSLRDYPIIALGKTQPVGAALRRLMNEADRQLRIAVEVSQSATAGALVEKGIGVAILDTLGLKDGRSRGLVSRPLLPRTTVRLSLIQPKGGETTKAMSTLCACIRIAAMQNMTLDT